MNIHSVTPGFRTPQLGNSNPALSNFTRLTSSGDRSFGWTLAILAVSLLAAFSFTGIAQAKTDVNAGTGVEVNIGSQGGVLVRGAKVTGVSSTTVNANTSLGSSILGWVVKTDNDTDFTAVKGATAGIANIAVGDIISFRGNIDQSMSGLNVKAQVVKDWTSVETKKTITGIVSSINATLNSFVVVHGSGTTTVQVASSTDIDKDGDNATFADIVLNAKVKIVGMLNNSTNILSALSVDIDADNDGHEDEEHSRKEFRNWLKANFNTNFKFWFH